MWSHFTFLFWDVSYIRLFRVKLASAMLPAVSRDDEENDDEELNTDMETDVSFKKEAVWSFYEEMSFVILLY